MTYKTVRPMVVDAVFADRAMDVETPNGQIHVPRGNWLVRECDGSAFVCDASYFARTFEPFDYTGVLESADEGKPCGC